MAKFQIMTPAGYEVEINADSESAALEKARATWETLPKIIHKGEGGVRVFEGPSGRYLVSPSYSTTDQAQIERVMAGETAGSQSRRSIQESILRDRPVAARAQEVVRGTPFIGSYTDEAIGAMYGEPAAIASRATTSAMQAQRPKETLGMNLTGGLLSGGAMAAAAPVAGVLGQGSKVSQAGRGLLAGLGAGAAEGAIYGHGEGHKAADSAMMGGALGGILGGAAPVVRGAAKNVMSQFSRSDVSSIARELGISMDAAKVIKATFDQGGDVAAAQSALQKAGSGAMIADAGPAAMALLDAASQSGGRAGQIVSEAISDRMASTGRSLDRALDETLGAAPTGPKAALRGIAAKSAPARREAYDAAYASTVDYSTDAGANVIGVLNRIDPKHISRAVDAANAELRDLGLMGSAINVTTKGGNVKFSAPPNVRQLDAIKRGLQEVALGETNDFGQLTGAGQMLSRQARDLRSALADAVPAYGEAVKLGGDAIAERGAFAAGQDILKRGTRTEDIAEALGSNPSADQVAAAKAGLRDTLAHTLGEVRAVASDPDVGARQVSEAFKQMSSPNVRTKMTGLLGDEALGLFSSLDEAGQAAGLRAALAQNSKTAARTAQREAIDEIASPSVVERAASGEPIEAAKRLVGIVTGVTDEYSAAKRATVYSDIAKALTSLRGDQARAAMDAIDKAIAGQSVTDSQIDAIASALTAAGIVGTAPTAARASSGLMTIEGQ